MLEGAPPGDPIPLRRETVAAFVGPAPRGPANIPVAVRSVAEYLQRFGSLDKTSRLEEYLTGFFDNGGTLAVVVRVCRDDQRKRIALPAGKSKLILEALHPGPLEYLRASVDYDQVRDDETQLFNLVIHRLDSGAEGFVAEQEIYRCVSADPQRPEFVGYELYRSELVRLVGDGPGCRPDATIGPTADVSSAWVSAEGGGGSPQELSDYDLIGSITEATGLHALEQVPCVDLLCVLPPRAGDSLGPVAVFAAERYCRRRNALLLMSPPKYWTSLNSILDDQHEHGLNSANVLTWFPEVNRGSAAGMIAGALVAADARQALSFDSLRLRGQVQPAQRLTLMESAALQRAGINTLSTAGTGRLCLSGGVDLGRAGGLSPEWYKLSYRRVALRVLGGVARGSRWAMFLADDPDSLMQLREQLQDYLTRLRRSGVLVGQRDNEAWYLHCPAPGKSNELTLQLGIAVRRPGEFLAFHICHNPANYRIRELGWQPVLALAS